MLIHDTVDINFNTGKTIVHCNPTSIELPVLLSDALQKYESPVVLVSGGLDSQLSAHWATMYTNNPTSVIYDFVWHDNTVNADDLVSAQRFCEHIELPYKIIPVDITDFLDHQLQTAARKYKCVSPQVLCHMHAIISSDFSPGTTLMMGGERQYIVNTKANKVSFTIERGRDPRVGLYKTYYAPFYTLAEELGITMLRDPCLLTPEIHYHMVKHNVDVIAHYNQIGMEQDQSVRNNMWRFKQKYYELLGYDFLWPLSKKTGFEAIQKHLASMSGVYNQYDVLYREPLRKICDKERWFGPRRPTVQFAGGGLDTLLKQAQELIDTRDLEIVNTYELTW